MHITFALNITLGATLIIVLILSNYLSIYNTDHLQRRIIITLMILVLIPIGMDFFYYSFFGMAGNDIALLLRTVVLIYYAVQFLAFYYCFVFIDYFTFKSPQRTKKILRFVWVLAALYFVVLVFNAKWNFFYSISSGNILVRENLYYILHSINYFPGLLAFADIMFFSKSPKRQPLVLVVVFVIFCGAGSVINGYFLNNTISHVFFSSAILYAYFFVIKTNTNIDHLTGLANRMCFNEFMEKLNKTSAKESYAIVLIDMDHFKMINDTLGHLEGDNALKDMAAIIKTCIRSSDFSARYGGDEFIIAARAENNIEALMSRISGAMKLHNETAGRPYKIEMSYGHDIFTTQSGIVIEEFLNHIDTLMYKHKNARRRASDKERR